MNDNHGTEAPTQSSHGTMKAATSSSRRCCRKPSCPCLMLLLLLLLVSVAISSSSSHRSSSFQRRTTAGVSSNLDRQRRRHHSWTISGDGSFLLTSLRGGSTAGSSDNISEDDDDEEEEFDDASSPTKEPAAAMSANPVTLVFTTAFRNPIVDVRHELTSTRRRTVAELKRSLSRSLPGKPPSSGIRLLCDGDALGDDMIVDDLLQDDDDEEEEDEDDGSSTIQKTVTLDMVPPLDDRFLVGWVETLRRDVVVDDDDRHDDPSTSVVSTRRLLEAYCMNQAFMVHNQLLLLKGDDGGDDNVEMPLTFRIQEQAQDLWRAFREQVPDDLWQDLVVDERRTRRRSTGPQWKGQRRRSGRVASDTIKASVQKQLNVDWMETTKTFLLLLFFGYFGGKTLTSRLLLILAAPLSVLIQTRALKVWIKTAFYMLQHPPLIFLSLLPAPEQVILSCNVDDMYETLYGSAPTREQPADGPLEEDQSEYEVSDEEEEDDE